MIRAALVVKQVSRPRIRSQQYIRETVIVDVTIRRSPRDFWRGEDAPHLSRDFGKLSAAQVSEQVRRLRITHSLLHALDLIFNMAVGDKNIGPTIIVKIKEETRKPQRDQARPAHL